jgi:hypothetical protein
MSMTRTKIEVTTAEIAHSFTQRQFRLFHKYNSIAAFRSKYRTTALHCSQ